MRIQAEHSICSSAIHLRESRALSKKRNWAWQSMMQLGEIRTTDARQSRVEIRRNVIQSQVENSKNSPMSVGKRQRSEISEPSVFSLLGVRFAR